MSDRLGSTGRDEKKVVEGILTCARTLPTYKKKYYADTILKDRMSAE